ncbi:hypothetical protein DFH09DRAFT_1362359 [Mycena vulgaris]|nr:hypothetical protein DFH09DRAFT_1362359 [Mycena vulgaris]
MPPHPAPRRLIMPSEDLNLLLLSSNIALVPTRGVAVIMAAPGLRLRHVNYHSSLRLALGLVYRPPPAYSVGGSRASLPLPRSLSAAAQALHDDPTPRPRISASCGRTPSRLPVIFRGPDPHEARAGAHSSSASRIAPAPHTEGGAMGATAGRLRRLRRCHFPIDTGAQPPLRYRRSMHRVCSRAALPISHSGPNARPPISNLPRAARHTLSLPAVRIPHPHATRPAVDIIPARAAVPLPIPRAWRRGGGDGASAKLRALVGAPSCSAFVPSRKTHEQVGGAWGALRWAERAISPPRTADVLDLAFTGGIHAAAIAHPSLLVIPDDLELRRRPTFPTAAQAQADLLLSGGRFSPSYKGTFFDGCAHGFAGHGDTPDPPMLAGKDGAFRETVEWLQRHLQRL